MIYPYSATNRLQHPHNYMYTAFEGGDLLEAYRKTRLDTIDWCRTNVSAGLGPEDLIVGSALDKIERDLKSGADGKADLFRSLLGTHSNLVARGLSPGQLEAMGSDLKEFCVDRETETAKLLEALVAARLSESPGSKTWIDRVIQRFEVSKKIYRRYMPGFRKGQGEDSDLRLYWLFALILALDCAESDDLKCLNTLLKLCDLLCSLPRDDISQQLPAGGLLLLLVTELSVIEGLLGQKGLADAI